MNPITRGVEREQLGWAVLGIVQAIAATAAPATPRTTVCVECGGLRLADATACDVCAALRSVRVMERAARRREDVIEDVTWLADTDHPQSIAARLGYSDPLSLARSLARWGEHALARRMTPTATYRTGGAA